MTADVYKRQLYNSVTYSMGEMGKKNAEKAEQAIVTYQTNIGEMCIRDRY